MSGQKTVFVNENAQMQMELNKLQKKFRVMESDRGAYSEEMRRVLLKQEQVIAQLEKEKAELITNLNNADNKPFMQKEAERVQKVKILLIEHDEIEYGIKHEGEELKELQKAIEKVEREISDLKNKHFLKDSNLEDIRKQERTNDNLTQRLHVASMRFNNLIEDNTKLRSDIDHMLMERGLFNRLFAEIAGKLNSGKKVLMDLIEQSTLAYDMREEALAKLDALKAKAKQDLLQHSQEMKELMRKLDHDSKLHDFLGVKGQRRLMVDLDAQAEAKEEQEKINMMRHLEEFKVIFETIKGFFKEEDTDRLASEFLKLEEDNFNLFSFINELNKQVGVLHEQVSEVCHRIDDQIQTNKQRTEEQAVTIDQLKVELEEKTIVADDLEEKLGESRAILNGLLAGIHEVFRFIQCDASPILKLLGLNTVVTDFNYILYLNILERKIKHLVDLVWYLSKSKVAKKAAVMYPGEVSTLKRHVMKDEVTPFPVILQAHEIVPTQPCPLCTEDVEISEVDETFSMPCRKEELIEILKPQMFRWDVLEKLHNVSACKLPKSRRIIQRRYQN